jgi:hypothetical protein
LEFPLQPKQTAAIRTGRLALPACHWGTQGTRQYPRSLRHQANAWQFTVCDLCPLRQCFCLCQTHTGPEKPSLSERRHNRRNC